MAECTPKPIKRSGPRFTVWIDFNLQWLWPRFGMDRFGLGYLHLAWLSVMFGFGISRDVICDAFDRGIPLKGGK